MKMPTGARLPWAKTRKLLLLLAAAEDADFGDLLVFGDDESPDTLLGDLGEHLVLQTTRQLLAGFNRLGFLVELALDDLHVLGDGQSLLIAFFALAFRFGEGDLAVFHLRDDRTDLVGEDDADRENEDQRGSEDFPQHKHHPLQKNSRSRPTQYRDRS